MRKTDTKVSVFLRFSERWEVEEKPPGNLLVKLDFIIAYSGGWNEMLAHFVCSKALRSKAVPSAEQHGF